MDEARIQAARERFQGQAARKARAQQLAPGEAAFDNPQTLADWKRTRRRVRWSLTLFSVVWTALFVALALVSPELDLSAKAEHNVTGGLGSLLFLSYLVILYFRLSSLRCLRRIRDVLRSDVWHPIPSARRHSGAKDPYGVPVQLDRGTGHAQDGPAASEPVRKTKGAPKFLSARNPVHRRRWHPAMEQGAWYAGDADLAVLALPGGTTLMELTPRQGY
ncbi:hypothetical protein ACWC2K_04880 [Streptomyces chattanoogensis]|uniref:hypothetical protein n=1 Tax=Streptomyces chattanoogensis TaxID=66876 RepID=UPI0036A70F2A